jgi:SAM-dependent methyltransferase
MTREEAMNKANNELKLKAMFRALTPPLVWRFLRRVVISSRRGEELGSERQSDYYDIKYSETNEYYWHYADSPYFLWCVLIDRIHPKEVRCLLDIGCGPGQFAMFLHDRGLGRYVGLAFLS